MGSWNVPLVLHLTGQPLSKHTTVPLSNTTDISHRHLDRKNVHKYHSCTSLLENYSVKPPRTNVKNSVLVLNEDKYCTHFTMICNVVRSSEYVDDVLTSSSP